MKTKNKGFALLEIAIVLCSLFLVTIPVTAIAAEQDDYVLGIYGNANEDDTIDMRDLTYVKLIFFGKKPETKLADAKYDGEINPLDFIQIKLIIVGKEKEITVIDTKERIETVKKPIGKIIVAFPHALETLRSLKVPRNMVIGIGDNFDTAFFPEFRDAPSVGNRWNPDVEAILNLNPDIFILHPSPGIFGTSTLDKVQDTCEAMGITVLRFRFNDIGIYPDEMKKLGYIFDKEDEAEKYLDWREEILNSIEEKVEKISEEDKTKVYYEATKTYYKSSPECSNIAPAGAKDIFADQSGSGSVDPEAVIERNPDIIVKEASWKVGGYDVDADNTLDLKKVRDEIMSRPELQKVKAVEDRKVYVISAHLSSCAYVAGCRIFIGIAYKAKWFYPDLFEDLDPKAIHQEYLTRFQGLNIDLDKMDVFVHPEPS